jgi:hypothetical protein
MSNNDRALSALAQGIVEDATKDNPDGNCHALFSEMEQGGPFWMRCALKPRHKGGHSSHPSDRR